VVLRHADGYRLRRQHAERATPWSATSACITSRPARGRWSSCCTASEFWNGWRLQIQPLVAAGFRVVAPDMRGYNLSCVRQGGCTARPGDGRGV